MPRTYETTVFEYRELSDKAKARARDWYREGGFHYDWWDFVKADFTTILAMAGMHEITDISFSGFCCQGDGASFTGTYYGRGDALKEIKAHAPQDKRLHEIFESFEALTLALDGPCGAEITRPYGGNYVHECTMYVNDVWRGNRDESMSDDDSGLAMEMLQEVLRRLAKWYYDQLEKEWDHLNSDDAIAESIEANEYEFHMDGRRAST